MDNTLLIRQWLDEFIQEFFVNRYELKYTQFYIKENSGYFYLKFIDQLRPSIYTINSLYYFNTFIVFKDNIQNLYRHTSKHELFKYLITNLDNSTEYLNYLNRFNK